MNAEAIATNNNSIKFCKIYLISSLPLTLLFDQNKNVCLYECKSCTILLLLIQISYKLVSVSHCVSFNTRSNYQWGNVDFCHLNK